MPDYRLDLCESLAGSGPPDRQGSRSLERLNEAIDLSSRLVDEYPKVPDYQSAQCRFFDRLGMQLLRSGKTDEAKIVYLEAFSRQSHLVKQYPDVIAYSFWLSLIERSLGEVFSKESKLPEAKSYLKKAIDRAESLRKQAPHLGGIPPFLGMAYRDLADVLSRAGETGPAAEARAKAERLPSPGRPKR